VLKIAVFVSGRGSNLKAILESPGLKKLVNVQAVLSDKNDCPAFNIAKENSIKTFSVGEKNRDINNDNLADFLELLDIGLIVLAGYLKLIPAELIKRFRNKIINIHPALLPSFGGKGMYGINVHKAVFNSSAQVTGASVHFVDETFDTGKIIAQRCVDISGVSSPDEIAALVLELEHELLPYVIKQFALGKINITNERIYILS
jgi:formyltetrahydrofolate-dependent phosphoribosylglycinamide formyltransferase